MSDAKARRPREIKPPSWSLTVSGKDDEHPALGTSRTGARKPPPCPHTVGTERGTSHLAHGWGIFENFPGEVLVRR